MDFKIKINQAFDELDKLTGEGSTKHLREAIAGESDPAKLFLKYQALRESLADMRELKEDVSFTVKMPDGVDKKFANLKAFFEDEITQADIKKQIKAANQSKAFSALKQEL